MGFVRRRPLVAAVLTFMHFPIFMGLWVWATEALAELRDALARGDGPAKLLAGQRRLGTS